MDGWMKRLSVHQFALPPMNHNNSPLHLSCRFPIFEPSTALCGTGTNVSPVFWDRRRCHERCERRGSPWCPGKNPKKTWGFGHPRIFFWVANRDLHRLHLFSNVFFLCGGMGGVNDLITLNKWFPNLSGSPNPK